MESRECFDRIPVIGRTDGRTSAVSSIIQLLLLGASFVLSTMPPVLSKKSAPTLPEEKIYYLKLLKLCVEVGIPVLQDVFDVIHMPTNLPGVLSTPKVQKELRQLQKKNVLHQSQIDILNLARKGSVTSAAFDISLLIVLLRNFCNITSSPTDAVWNSEPSTADKSKAADIVRIRLCRNNLYHRTNLAVTESDFEKKWDEIKHALIRLGGGTKYEEDIQNIKFGSVDPEIEEHYHDLLRSREETERKTEETLDNLKTGQQNLKQKLDEVGEKLVYAEIIIKTTFKLFAAGTVTLGWAAGCTYFLNRYKDDPEIVTGLVQRAIIPGTLAWGVTVVGILRGSIIIKVKVTSLAALDYLWKSYGEGEMEENLQKVIVTDGLIQHAPHGTDGVEISVTMSEDEYQTARNTLLGECPVNIKSHNRERSLDLFQKKIMRKNNETEPSSTDTRQTAPSEKEKTGRQDLDEMVEDQMPKKCGGTKYEEDFQNIKVRSVNPKMEQHYAEIFRLRVEREKLKSGHEDLKHELEEIIEKHVNRITKFKLFAAGTVTLGWAAGCTYFLLRYKDDPEEVINLVRHALIPGTLAMGMTVAGLLWR
ncbi:E3 ubiquitin-protein ligase DZIP3 [Exaiptasia diaphana]|nr:E3 ubiquitin-protein ligase DZIP3 [Exaiptasia diaphana]